ncbi:MAG: hypothetical protein ABIH00_03245 [Armatimonadota bacterium]
MDKKESTKEEKINISKQDNNITLTNKKGGICSYNTETHAFTFRPNKQSDARFMSRAEAKNLLSKTSEQKPRVATDTELNNMLESIFTNYNFSTINYRTDINGKQHNVTENTNVHGKKITVPDSFESNYENYINTAGDKNIFKWVKVDSNSLETTVDKIHKMNKKMLDS